MSQIRSFCLIVSSLVFYASAVQAAELGKITYEGGGLLYPCGIIRPLVSLNPGDDNPPQEIFENLVLTTADVGRAFTITSDEDDSDFSKFAQALVNGVDDQIGLGRQGGYTTNPESFWFGKTPDFKGNQITSITLTLDSFTFVGSYGDSGCEYSFKFTLAVHGVPSTTAPVPALSDWGIILCSVLICLLAAGHIRKRMQPLRCRPAR